MDDQYNGDRVGEACGRNEKSIEENLKETDCLRELGVDERLVSKRT